LTGAAQTILGAPDARGVSVNSDGTAFVVLEQPCAAAQTVRVLTH
jgi:hypothetical protein